MNKSLLLWHLLFIAVLGFSISPLWATDTNKLPLVIDTDVAIVSKYNKLLQKMSKITCSHGTEESFNKLLKNYRGNGFFLPITYDDHLDDKTISKFLPSISTKISWIKSQRQKLKSHQTLKHLLKNISELRLVLDQLLEQKKIFSQKDERLDKLNAEKKSADLFKILKIKYNKLITDASFFLPYDHPTNYLSLRRDYDEIKNEKDDNSVRKANDIFFQRKIKEDGSANHDHSGNDIFLRTTLSTLHLSFEENHNQITEDQRFDLEYVLEAMEYYLKSGIKHIDSRLREWEERTQRIYFFYKRILEGKYLDQGTIVNSEDLVRIKSKEGHKLHEMVITKFISVYRFWANQDELMSLLFAMDTILYNEIGEIDSPDALERKDVAQVIINRFFEEKYAHLSPRDSLWKNLFGDSKEKRIDENRWLNILFKEGEFSFTFYYMPASLRVFCPSMTRQSKMLRQENLSLALSALRKPDNTFNALRYFSRVSMLGRIDMTSIWRDYIPIAERPGKLIKQNKHLITQYNQNLYKFLYRFKSDTNNTYDVIQIKNKSYARDAKTGLLYQYRSPHHFKYFQKK